MKKTGFKGLLAGALALVFLSGCGSSSGNYSATADYEPASYAEEAAYASDSYNGSDVYDYDYKSADTTGSAKAETPQVQDNSRKLITTVHLSAETNDFDTCINNLTSRVENLGGYIESSEIYNGSRYYYYDNSYAREKRNADLTIRIPADKLGEYLNLVNESTNIVSKSQSVEDVTLDYVDMASHKKALQTEEERLLELLEKAETIEDMITIESRLSDVRYQIESMESQLRTFDNKVNYSTVYLSLTEVVEYTPEEEEPPVTFWDRITSGFIEDLHYVWGNITDFVVWFISHIPSLVVWAIIICIVVFVVRKVRNRNMTPSEIAEKKEAKKRLKEQRREEKKRMKEMGKNSVKGGSDPDKQ